MEGCESYPKIKPIYNFGSNIIECEKQVLEVLRFTHQFSSCCLTLITD